MWRTRRGLASDEAGGGTRWVRPGWMDGAKSPESLIDAAAGLQASPPGPPALGTAQRFKWTPQWAVSQAFVHISGKEFLHWL